MNSEVVSGGVTRSSGRIRRTALACGTAAAAALLAAGCSAGQVAETARKAPSAPGANGQATVSDTAGAAVGTVSVRDVQVVYKDSAGYPPGGTAPLDVRIFNDTSQEVTVDVSSPAADSVVLTVGAAAPTRAPEPAESASPDASGSPNPSSTAEPGPSTEPSPSAKPSPSAAGEPARLTIPAGGFVVLNPNQARYLQLTGLTKRLPPGGSVPLVFDFGKGVTIKVNAPAAVPLTPLPRATPEAAAEGEHG